MTVSRRHQISNHLAFTECACLLNGLAESTPYSKYDVRTYAPHPIVHFRVPPFSQASLVVMLPRLASFAFFPMRSPFLCGQTARNVVRIRCLACGLAYGPNTEDAMAACGTTRSDPCHWNGNVDCVSRGLLFVSRDHPSGIRPRCTRRGRRPGCHRPGILT